MSIAKDVRLKMRALIKAFATIRADVRLSSRVHTLMFHHVTVMVESLIAVFACVRLLSRVDSHVHGQTAALGQSFAA